MAQTLVEKVGSFALYSRILVICMQAFFNYLMPDHDAKVFGPPNIHRINVIDKTVSLLLDGFRRWDAIYFLHIAEYGYTYERSLAFFPLFPMTVRLVANTVFFPLQYIMNYSSVLLISAVCTNFCLFIKSAKVLCALGVKVMGDESLAYKAALLYCINPASIFFSAAYSETMFAFICFSAMLNLEENRMVKSSIYFGLSSLCRSNGLVACAFLLYRKVKDFVQQVRIICKEGATDCKTGFIAGSSIIWLSVSSTLLYTVLATTPFLLYQYYAYTVFCNPGASYKDMKPHILNYGNNQIYKMPHSGLSVWCYNMLPLSYTYVQSQVWDNGLFKYYQLKQIPNFILAMPMVLLCFATTFHYLRKNPRYCLTLGLGSQEFYKQPFMDKYDDPDVAYAKANFGFTSQRCFVYIVYMMALVVFGLLFMHVQVITRFIASSCPVVYWFVASITMPEGTEMPRVNKFDVFRRAQMDGDQTSNGGVSESLCDDIFDWDNKSWSSKVIFIYFHLYFFVGIGAFSNFLPWT